MFMDRQFRIARVWSNQELKKFSGLFGGDVVNVSAWDDRDKEGGCYKSYFSRASHYYYTNYGGTRGLQGCDDEFAVDLSGEVPADLQGRFDTAFNHTTLEHVFDARKAFSNICRMSRDAVIVVVPFSQVQHETDSYGDYWRFTPSCVRALFRENGLDVIYEAESTHRKAAVYLLFVGSRHADRWRGKMPVWAPIQTAGAWIGFRRSTKIYEMIKRRIFKSRHT